MFRFRIHMTTIRQFAIPQRFAILLLFVRLWIFFFAIIHYIYIILYRYQQSTYKTSNSRYSSAVIKRKKSIRSLSNSTKYGSKVRSIVFKSIEHKKLRQGIDKKKFLGVYITYIDILECPHASLLLAFLFIHRY